MRRPALAEGWPTLLLLCGSVFLAFHPIREASWGVGLELAPLLALLGVLIGLLGAKSPLRPVWSLLLSLWIGSAAVLASQALAAPGRGWAERLVLPAAQLWSWYSVLPAVGPIHDQLVFSSALAAAAYLIGLCCAWLVFRFGNGWAPVITLAAIGLLHLSYLSGGSIPRFIASLVLGLLAVASLELYSRRAEWLALRIPVQGASTAWTLASAMLVVGLALILASRLPAGQFQAARAEGDQALTGPWQETRRLVHRFVGGGRGPTGPAAGLSFSQQLVPRQEFDLGSEPLLAVRADRPAYWRTATYDQYDGRSIRASVEDRRQVGANRPMAVDPEASRSRQTVEQTVTILSASANAAFAPEAPFSFGAPVNAEVRAVDWDLASVRLAPALQRGQSYTLQASISIASRDALIEAGQLYPAWLDRYLALPESVPGRVGALAAEVAAGAGSPFQRAMMIEAHLRGLTYETRTTAPPAERDWADYVLFDSQSGYCDYFATTMVVMLRTQGIPARVASGFAPGPFDEGRQAWLLRESEAHSWVEVYFPGYGWQVFEPSATRRQPERVAAADRGRLSTADSAGLAGRVGAEAPVDETGLSRLDQEPAAGGSGLTPLGTALVALGAGAALLGALGRLLVWNLNGGLDPEPAARRRYLQLRRLLDWAGWAIADSATPYEVARQASRRLPGWEADLWRLAEAYSAATYGLRLAADEEATIEAAWSRLRRPLLLAAVRRLLRLERSLGAAHLA
jgi:transglutaminase-like putative cysteine protease